MMYCKRVTKMAENKLSHAYMLIGPDGDGRERAVKRLSAALLCAEADPPCMRCRDCRKAAAGIHPDIITVERQYDEKGRLRQEILVGQIRAVVSDAYIAPNEAIRKVYIVREADRLNTEAQNALLKALEEPPGHACFLLCSATADALLPTIRSRCVRVDDADRDPALSEPSELARTFIGLAAAGDPAEMTRFCLLRGKLTREDASALLEEIADTLGDILAGRRKNPGLTPRGILRLTEQLERAGELLRRNIQTKQVFGLLAAQYDLYDVGDTDD